jgi:Tetratricopeptide repeat
VQVMETTKRVLGQEHPDTLTSMNNLAFIIEEQGRTGKAIELMAEYV